MLYVGRESFGNTKESGCFGIRYVQTSPPVLWRKHWLFAADVDASRDKPPILGLRLALGLYENMTWYDRDGIVPGCKEEMCFVLHCYASGSGTCNSSILQGKHWPMVADVVPWRNKPPMWGLCLDYTCCMTLWGYDMRNAEKELSGNWHMVSQAPALSFDLNSNNWSGDRLQVKHSLQDYWNWAWFCEGWVTNVVGIDKHWLGHILSGRL